MLAPLPARGRQWCNRIVRAVLYRMTRALRAQWRATLVLTVIVAAVTGLALAVATGAERTSSAPDRYTASRGYPFEGAIEQPDGLPRTAEVAALPGAASVEAATFVFAALVLPGSSESPDTYVFAGSPLAFGLRLVEGRQPERPEEFVATRAFLDIKGVDLGTTFELRTVTQEQADLAGFGAFGDGSGDRVRDAVVVGLVEGPTQFDDPTPVVLFPASLLDEDVGASATIMSVRLRTGTDLAALRSELDTLPAGGTLSLEPSEVISSEVRTAVEAQALGLWLLAVVAAVAALAVLGQLVTRSVRLTVDERRRMVAIGFSRGQLLAESVGRAAVPIVTGTVLGAGVAAVASLAFPTGFVRRMEPDPGVWVDPAVLALGTAGLLLALIAWTAAALVGRRSTPGVERPSGLVESVASRSGSATLATGFRFAFTRARRDRDPSGPRSWGWW